MADAAATPTGADLQTLRSRAVIGSLAWAYLAALGRGDAGRASALLSTFQAIWNSHKTIVAGKFSAAVRDAIVSSGALRVGGGLDADTLAGLKFALAGQYNHAEWAARLGAMPSGPVALASHYNAQLKPLVATTHDLYVLDELAQSTPTPEIPGAVGGEVEAVILGLEREAPRPTFTPTRVVSTQKDYYLGPRSSESAAVTKLPGAAAGWWSKQSTVVRGSIVVGGAAVLGGALAYFLWGRR
jgi:hypothetical protein